MTWPQPCSVFELLLLVYSLPQFVNQISTENLETLEEMFQNLGLHTQVFLLFLYYWYHSITDNHYISDMRHLCRFVFSHNRVIKETSNPPPIPEGRGELSTWRMYVCCGVSPSKFSPYSVFQPFADCQLSADWNNTQQWLSLI